MFDDCRAALADGAPSEDDDEHPSIERRLFELLPAAMIVGLAFAIDSALLRTGEPEPAAPARTAADAAPEPEAADFRFATLPLRAALKEMGADRTGSIRRALPTSAALTLAASQRPPRVERRAKPPPAMAEIRPRARLLSRRATKPNATNPLTVVGSAAGAMAERFATDLRALPAQISAIFKSR